MNLVIDHQTPVLSIQDTKVSKFTFTLGGHDGVTGDRDGLDVFDHAGILPDVVLGEVGAGQKFIAPLTGRDRVGHQNQGARIELRHHTGAHEGFPRTTGQHHHTRTALAKTFHGLDLVVTKVPAALGQGNIVGSAVREACMISGGPPALEQFLLNQASGPGG